MSQGAGYPVSFFGLFELPVLVDKDPSLAQFFRGVHGTVWILLVVAVIGHGGAALHHHFVRKDDVLKKMSLWSKANTVRHIHCLKVHQQVFPWPSD